MTNFANIFYAAIFCGVFYSLGIRSIINLQSPKEHASCGEPLEESGFSYNPNLFMENNSKSFISAIILKNNQY